MKNSSPSTGRKAKKPADNPASNSAASSQPPVVESETADTNAVETAVETLAETDSVESPDSSETTDAVPVKKRTVDDINNQLYREAAQRILDAIEAGTSIWQKPWNPPSAYRRPYSLHTGLPYRGINRLLLTMEIMANGWTDMRFMTYKQVQSLAQDMKKAGTPDADLPHVKKGAKSITIYKVGRQEIKRDMVDASGKPVLDESGKPVKEISLGKTFLQTYRVFNGEQVANLPPLPQAEPTPTWALHAQIEDLVKKQGVPVRYESQDSAYYEPLADRITVPERSQYHDTVKDGKVVLSGAAKHYSVLIHECCHSSGHESRLNRLMNGARGTDSYSREELTAETASAFLMAELGLESDEVIKQHASYLDHWAKMIRDDPKALFQAMSAAEKAADWFMQRHERQLASAASAVSPAPGLAVGVGVQAPAVAAMTAAATLTPPVSAPGMTSAMAPGGFGVVDRLPVSGTPTLRVNGLRPIADVVAGMAR